jgi:hypothetical protein
VVEKLVENDDDNLIDGDGKANLPQNWIAEINGMKPIDQQISDGNYPTGQVKLIHK